MSITRSFIHYDKNYKIPRDQVGRQNTAKITPSPPPSVRSGKKKIITTPLRKSSRIKQNEPLESYNFFPVYRPQTQDEILQTQYQHIREQMAHAIEDDEDLKKFNKKEKEEMIDDAMEFYVNDGAEANKKKLLLF